ncbi:MAG: class II aldolase/adducin family protein [Christensenella sp.]
MAEDFFKKYEKEIMQMVSASNRLAELGYVASHGGNLSMRVADDIILITPTKVAKRDIECKDICAVDLAGNTIFAPHDRKPTGETPMHTHIYEKRADVRSVIHSHAPILTGFAIARTDILEYAILPEPVLELGPVLSIPYKEPLTQALADAMDEVIDKTNAFLMQNHGVTVMSTDTIERTLDLTEMLEQMARSVFVASQMGSVHKIANDEIVNLDRVRSIRNLPMPGKAGEFASLEDVYGNTKEGKK